MTAIFTELDHIFVWGPAGVRLRGQDFLALVKTYWWPQLVFFPLSLGCCLLDTFPISILNFISYVKGVEYLLLYRLDDLLKIF